MEAASALMRAMLRRFWMGWGRRPWRSIQFFFEGGDGFGGVGYGEFAGGVDAELCGGWRIIGSDRE